MFHRGNFLNFSSRSAWRVGLDATQSCGSQSWNAHGSGAKSWILQEMYISYIELTEDFLHLRLRTYIEHDRTQLIWRGTTRSSNLWVRPSVALAFSEVCGLSLDRHSWKIERKALLSGTHRDSRSLEAILIYFVDSMFSLCDSILRFPWGKWTRPTARFDPRGLCGLQHGSLRKNNTNAWPPCTSDKTKDTKTTYLHTLARTCTHTCT